MCILKLESEKWKIKNGKGMKFRHWKYDMLMRKMVQWNYSYSSYDIEWISFQIQSRREMQSTAQLILSSCWNNRKIFTKDFLLM